MVNVMFSPCDQIYMHVHDDFSTHPYTYLAMMKRECAIKASPCYRNGTKVHMLFDFDT